MMEASVEHILTPLEDAEKQIRLLRPVGGRCVEYEALEFTLSTYYRSEAPSYRAISYTWGQPGNELLILIDGKQRQVRQNCHYALWQAEWHFPNDFLWIDSVCIDQANLGEKNMQVLNMGDTYKQADQVLACVGSHADDSDWLASLIAVDETGLVKKCNKSSGEFPTSYSDQRLWEAQKQLACRDYWTRVWVVPEMINAAKVLVLVGDVKLSWNTLEAIEKASRPYLPYLKAQGCFGSMNFIRSTTAHSLESAMGYFSAKGCSDPRDRIYAYCSIIDWLARYPGRPPLRPDYTLSPFELAQKLVPYASNYDIEKILIALELKESEQVIQRSLRQRRWQQYWDELRVSSARSERTTWNIGRRVVIRLTQTYNGHLTGPFRGDCYDQDSVSFLDQLHLTGVFCEAFAGRPPQHLISGSRVIGFACNEARAGDLLCAWQDRNNCLVLRHNQSDCYDIIGQAILNEDASLWRPTEFGDSPQRRPEGESLEANVSLDLTAEDVVVYYLQGLFGRHHGNVDSGDEDEGDRDIHEQRMLKHQMKRLVTKVTATPCRAAKMVDMVDPVDDPDWETIAHI